MTTLTASTPAERIADLLGDRADELLHHRSETIDKSRLHLPGPDFVERIYAQTDRSPQVLRSIQSLFDHGRLAGTGYVSILPVDQGIEHSAGASFAPNPDYFDPQRIVELAIEGGCNAVASTFGVLAATSRRYAHRIPYIVKINHNEILSYPNTYDQTMYGSVDQAWNLGAAAVGATIYFGSPESRRQITEVAEAFARAHELGMFTVLWCYLRSSAFKVDGVDYHTAADLTAQANHLGVTIEADIIKQKLPEVNGGYEAVGHGKTHPKVTTELSSDNPSAGGRLLPRPRAADQLRRRQLGRVRSRRGRPHGRRQQARGRRRAHLGPQGVPAAARRGRRTAERDPGRLPLRRRHRRLNRDARAARMAAARA
jgi:class I fructose-bisphosphate aldolase